MYYNIFNINRYLFSWLKWKELKLKRKKCKLFFGSLNMKKAQSVYYTYNIVKNKLVQKKRKQLNTFNYIKQNS